MLNGSIFYFKCKKCGEEFYGNAYKYCPECGEKTEFSAAGQITKAAQAMINRQPAAFCNKYIWIMGNDVKKLYNAEFKYLFDAPDAETLLTYPIFYGGNPGELTLYQRRDWINIYDEDEQEGIV